MRSVRYRPQVLTLEDRCLPSTVTNLADSGAGSLRDALANTPAGGTINFAPGLTGSLTLTSAALMITQNVSIMGPGAATLTINADALFQVFNVSASTTASISGLTISNGTTGSTGGGILNNGNLTLANDVISGNQASSGDGAGLYNNHNSLTLMNCTVSSNSTANGNGAGIYNNDGSLTITNSNISGNSTPNSGNGAGLFNNSGTVMLTNVTIANNQSMHNNGGGVFVNGGSLTATNSTIANNSAMSGFGGGIAIGTGSVTLRNTLVAGNNAPTGPDINGTISSGNNNLLGNGTGSSGLVNGTNGNQVGSAGSVINAHIGSLQNNGGPVQTVALLSGSPAIDQGSNAIAPATDARGFNRIINNTVDIGAYEFQPPGTNTTLGPVTTGSVGQTITFQATVSSPTPGANTPTGNVAFLDGGRTLGTVALTNGQASFSTALLTGGSHRITAKYQGLNQGDYVLSSSTSAAANQFITGGIFAVGGAPGHVQVRNTADNSLLADFMPYGSSYTGGISVAIGDVTGDGYLDVVTGATSGNPDVAVFDGKAFVNHTFNPSNPNASRIVHFFPYGLNFNVGANVAVGYISGSNFADIVTGATAGNPHVKVYLGQAIANGSFNPNNPDANLLATFFPYAMQFNVGANVAVGDVNGDGFADVVTGATIGNPHVKVYGGAAIANSTLGNNPESDLLAQFFPYGLNFNVGAYVAVGDANGDGFGDVITGASTGNPDVRVYNGAAIANGTFNNNNPIASQLDAFFAYQLQFNVGAAVAAADFNGDGRAEILTGATSGNPHFRVVSATSQGIQPPSLFEAIPSDIHGGVLVGA